MIRNPNLMPPALLLSLLTVAANHTARAQQPSFFVNPVPVSFCQGANCNDRELTMTADELLAVFSSDRPNPGSNAWDLWYVTRLIPGAPWSAPQPIGGVNTGANERGPGLSPDGLELYFTRRAPGGGASQMFVAQRPDRNAAWGQPILLGPPINSAGLSVFDPQPTADGLKLFFCTDEAGPKDIFMVERAAPGAAWSNKQPVPAVNDPGANESGPAPSANGSILWFSSNRPGGAGGHDFYVSWLQASSGTWTTPLPIAELNTSDDQLAAFSAASTGLMYFNSVGNFSLDDILCICRKTPKLSTEGGANGYVEGQSDPNWSTPVTFSEGDNWSTGSAASLSLYDWPDIQSGATGFWGTFMSGARLPTSVPLPFVTVGAQELEPSSLSTLGFSGGSPFGYATLNVTIPPLPALSGLEVWIQSAYFRPNGEIRLSEPRRISIL